MFWTLLLLYILGKTLGNLMNCLINYPLSMSHPTTQLIVKSLTTYIAGKKFLTNTINIDNCTFFYIPDSYVCVYVARQTILLQDAYQFKIMHT